MSTGFQRQEKIVIGALTSPIGTASESLARTSYTTPTGFASISSKLLSIHADQTGDAFDYTLGNTSAGHCFGTSNRARALEISAASSGAATLQTFAGDLTVDCGVNYAVFASDIKIGTATITKSSDVITLTLPSVTSTLVSDAGTQSIGGDKTFTGTISVPTPTLAAHAATKAYVDSAGQTSDFKQSVRVASTTNVPLAGAVPLTIDGVTVSAGDRILLKNQSTASENGIYTVSISGTYTLTRSTDADTSAKVTPGLFVVAEEGAQVGRGFVLTTAGPINLGVTSLTFTLFNPASTSYTAGDGLQLIGNAFSVDTTVVRTSGTQTIGGVKTWQNNQEFLADINVGASAAYGKINGSGSDLKIASSVSGGIVLDAGTNSVYVPGKIAVGSGEIYLGDLPAGTDRTRLYTASVSGQKSVAVPPINGTLIVDAGAQTITGVKTINENLHLVFGTSGNNYIYGVVDDLYLTAGATLHLNAPTIDITGTLDLGDTINVGADGKLYAPIGGPFEITSLNSALSLNAATYIDAVDPFKVSNGIYFGVPGSANYTKLDNTPSGQHTITFPSITGTVIVDAGAQTITGDKTIDYANKLFFGDSSAWISRVVTPVSPTLFITGPQNIELGTTSAGGSIKSRGKLLVQNGTENARFTVDGGNAVGLLEIVPGLTKYTLGVNSGSANLEIKADTGYVYFSTATAFDSGAYFGGRPGAADYTKLDSTASGQKTVTLPALNGTVILDAGAQTITGVKTIANDTNFNIGTGGGYIQYVSISSDVDIFGVDALSLSTTNPAGVVEVERKLTVLDTIVVGSYAKFYTDNTTDATLKNLSGTLILDSNDFIRAAKPVYAQGGLSVGGSTSAANYTLINGTASGANTITAPAITGTMVLTEGTQTINGQKSFTANKTYFGNSYSYLQDGAPGLAIVSDDSGTPANGLIYVFASNYVEIDAPLKVDDGVWFGVPAAANSTKIDAAGGVGAAKTVLAPFIDGTMVVDAGTQSIGGDKTFTGTISVPTPTSNAHAATKAYVDSFSSGIKFRDAVRVSSTANVPLTGAVPLIIDGVTVANGDRILLKNQTLSQYNGIYDAAVAGTYTLTRSADASGANLVSGIYTFSSEGTANGGFSFVLTTPNPITQDVTPLSFAIFSQAQVYSAGNGLQLNTGTFSVASTVSTTNFEATGYLQTPLIKATTVGGTISFNGSDISNVNDLSADTITVPVINATGSTTIGNGTNTTTIDGSRVDITGPAVVDQTLRINADTDQFALGTDAINHLHISANTGAFVAPKTYDIPISSNSTATFGIIEGSAPGAAGYMLASTGTDHLAQWVQSAPLTAVKTTVNTAALTTTALVTIATTTGRCYIATIDVVAKRTDNGSILTFTTKVPVKNIGGTVTVGTTLNASYAYDSAGFAGTEIGYIASGTNFVVNTTPTNIASTNWTTRVSYDYVD